MFCFLVKLNHSSFLLKHRKYLNSTQLMNISKRRLSQSSMRYLIVNKHFCNFEKYIFILKNKNSYSERRTPLKSGSSSSLRLSRPKSCVCERLYILSDSWRFRLELASLKNCVNVCRSSTKHDRPLGSSACTLNSLVSSLVLFLLLLKFIECHFPSRFFHV